MANSNSIRQFKQAEYEEKHSLEMARRMGLARRHVEQVVFANDAKLMAEQRYKNNPTKKNYRVMVVAISRALKA